MSVSGNRVEKIMESLMVKELNNKDLFPPGPRKAMLYLGSNAQFEARY